MTSTHESFRPVQRWPKIAPYIHTSSCYPCQVETIGDAYMAVSGAPTITRFHALHMCDMALDMRESMSALVNPASNESMKIRIVAFDVISETALWTIESVLPYCDAMKIHISETTKRELEKYPYEVEERGSIQVKGKGTMKTYWLRGKRDIPESEMPQCPFLTIMQEEVKSRKAEETLDTSRASESMGSQAALHSYSPVSFKDMRMDAASPLGHAGSGAAAAAGLLGLDGNIIISSSINNTMEQNNSPKLGAVPSTPRKMPPRTCPFASGMMGKPPDASSASLSKDTAQNVTSSGSRVNGPSVENSSTPAVTPVKPSNPTDANTGMNSSSQTRRGLTSLDSGISITGPHSTQQEGEVGKDNQVPKVNVFRPNQAPAPTQNEIPTATIPCSHENAKLKDETQINHAQSGHSPPASHKPPSQFAHTSPHSVTNPSGFSAKNNDNNHICRNEEERIVEGQSKMSPTRNGNATEEIYNSILSDKNSKNGTHVIRKDEGLLSASGSSKSGSAKKSKMCNVL
ncbi:soluble guanylate cyclase 88E [Elysia marginata]|uniref:Soluble guanylate cyclase 88E n=1 Tax=Elysia marginata TaxID=1093978 RepID=A0AAV4JBZ8_9GAST|nr:soluble guanylate cyclase 88E [Elysia marginata]